MLLPIDVWGRNSGKPRRKEGLSMIRRGPALTLTLDDTKKILIARMQTVLCLAN